MTAPPTPTENALPVAVKTRPPLFHPDFPTILFWSQKSGCTQVVRWFFAQIGLYETAKAYDPWIHTYRTQVFQKDPHYKRQVAEALASGRYRAVKVVREPLTRAASAFLVLGEAGAVRDRYHWVQGHWRAVREHLTADGRDPDGGIDFLSHLAMLSAWKAAGRPINLHLTPQAMPGEADLLHEVVPIERFNDWTVAQEAAGRAKPVPDAVFRRSSHHHGSDADRTARLGERPERVRITPGAFRDGVFPAAAALVNERSRPAIAATYARDLARYGVLYGLGADAAALPGATKI